MTDQNDAKRHDARRDAETLVPWVVTGRATDAQKATVARAIEADAGLAASLAGARAEATAARQSGEQLGMPSAGALARLMTVARANPSTGSSPGPIPAVRPVPASPGLLDRLAGWLQGLAPARLGLLATAAAALIVVQAGTLGWHALQRTDPARFTTASDPTATLVGPSGTIALVTFRSDVSAADIARALDGIGAEIVAGPRGGGTFHIRLSTRTGPSRTGPSAEAALERVKATGITSFAVLAK